MHVSYEHNTQDEWNIFTFTFVLGISLPSFPETRLYLEFPAQDYFGTLFKFDQGRGDYAESGDKVGCLFSDNIPSKAAEQLGC